MTDQKPREWEICRLSDGRKSNEWVSGPETHRVFVIEKSAYDDLKHQLDSAQCEWRRLQRTPCEYRQECLERDEEIEKLKAEVERLKNMIFKDPLYRHVEDRDIMIGKLKAALETIRGEQGDIDAEVALSELALWREGRK